MRAKPHPANPAMPLGSTPEAQWRRLGTRDRSISHRDPIRKRLKPFSIALVALLLFTIPGPVSAQQTAKIQESHILDLLKSMDAALLKKDAKAACTSFADDATITIVLLEAGEKYIDTYDKKKYQANLETGLPNFNDYTSKRSGTQIHIAADGKTATAESTFVEEFRRNGIKMGCTSKESYSFALRDGRIVIKTMSNVAKMQ
jgi:hypothetical protein